MFGQYPNQLAHLGDAKIYQALLTIVRPYGGLDYEVKSLVIAVTMIAEPGYGGLYYVDVNGFYLRQIIDHVISKKHGASAKLNRNSD